MSGAEFSLSRFQAHGCSETFGCHVKCQPNRDCARVRHPVAPEQAILVEQTLTETLTEALPEAVDKWYIVDTMSENDYDNTPEVEVNTEAQELAVPVGIARIRDEWRAAGLIEGKAEPAHQGMEPVVFPEVDGGAGIGDYTFNCDMVRTQLALSQDAVDRLVASGELDSILVQGPNGISRRLFSEASVNRFRADSSIDPEAIKRAAKQMADASVAEAINELQAEIEELKNTQGVVLQQMKDMLLLEIRNLKEQDRDLTSFVYELTNEIKARMPKPRR